MNIEWFEKLGLMGWPLAFCSIIALAVIFERLIFMLKQSTAQESTYERLASVLHQNKSRSKAIRDDLTAISLNELQRPFNSGLKTLRSIGTISPILGLLGTVLGIIGAFQKIAASTGAVNPAMIADGLWEALLTTAIGLSIALPCLLAAQAYKAWEDKILDSFCIRLNRLSLSFEIDNQEQAAVHKIPERKAA